MSLITPENAADHDLPVVPEFAAAGAHEPADGIAICLSGGGYRAMVFHLGAIWRLYEAGILEKADRISSVSGGSITAAALALAWPKLTFGGDPRADFVPHVVEPILHLAGRTIDVGSVLKGLLLPGTPGQRLAKAYDDHLLKGATLQDLPSDPPRFVINATNLQSGALWRFSRPYMADWKVGKIENPTLPLCQAVAASSAFPPVLSPMTLKLDPKDYTANSGDSLQHEPFTSGPILTDGGVYDNLGLETTFKNCKTVFVSDGGGRMGAHAKIDRDWVRQLMRIFNVVNNQVHSLRTRQLVAAYLATRRRGAYWSTFTDLASVGVPSALDCPPERTAELADLGTRLKKMKPSVQKRMINWGYAICDASLRAHYDEKIPASARFPYPKAGV